MKNAGAKARAIYNANAALKRRSSTVLWSHVLLVALLLAPWLSSAPAQAQAAKYPQTIVFMTDFGVVDDSVALCKGVMYSIMPSVRIVDLTHEVTPFSILDGARFLYGATPYFPAGTVFVVVIDPTVGSSRKAIVAKSKRGQFFVLPDNGLLTLVEQRDGIEAVREVTNPDWMIGGKMSSTFHGRDIFSPVGAHVARGDDWTKVGPEMAVASLVRLQLQAAHIERTWSNGGSDCDGWSVWQFGDEPGGGGFFAAGISARRRGSSEDWRQGNEDQVRTDF